MKPKIRLTQPQTQALISLLCTIGAGNHCMDLTQATDSSIALDVTIWRGGDPITWEIAGDGFTKET